MVNVSRSLQLRVKYAIDKILAVIGLVVTLPVIIIVSIILKGKGYKVFYLQRRVGEGGREFYVYKFTTMPEGSEKLGLITTANDSRPFKFGKFLRRTKVNEVPQLINVLNGTMSFVGPRPLIREQLKEVFSEEEIKEYYQMRPGITGAGSLWYHHEDALLAQVSDPYEFYREVVMPKKMELEKAYANNWNLWLDVKIFILTVMVLLMSAVGIDTEKVIQRSFEKMLGVREDMCW